VNRYIGYGSLALVISWLVLSYSNWLPATLRIGAPLSVVGPWFQGVTAAILLCFIAIQLWLLVSTWQIVRRQRQDDTQTTGAFSLSLFGELFWTVLPLLLTIGLVLAGYQLWATI
jgi:heme/copper-type cytochrome/quinol oxidase subunit 2